MLGEVEVAARYHQAALEDSRRSGDRRSTAELLLLIAEAVRESRATPDSEDSVRALLEEASSLSHQIDWREGLQRIEERLAQLAPE